MLSAGAQATDPLSAEAVEALLRWDIAAVLPDARGQTEDSAPRITRLRGFHLAMESGPDQLLVCATLIFDEPETEPTGVAVIYALAQATGPRLLGSPYFYGMNWRRGEVPLADACDAAASGMGWTAVAQGRDP
jgi:hypothetical protein